MAGVKVKSTVQPRSLTIMAAIANVAQTLRAPAYVLITSGHDGRHMKGSRHYTDEALDVRTRSLGGQAEKTAFVTAVLGRLGPDYQGLLEDVGGPNEHAHFEYDPRRPV